MNKLNKDNVLMKRYIGDFAKVVEGSKRSKNEDGYLRVEDCPVMIEGVSPYYGYEIAGDHDLDPKGVYYAYRPAQEIQKAMDGSNGIPLLIQHVPDSSINPQKDIRVGSVGTSAVWDGSCIRNTLTVTDQAAIDKIEDRTLRELSPAYYYDVDFTKGDFNGIPYDFVMKNIRFNHLALVSEARQGDMMYVADEAPKGIKQKVNNMNRKQFARKVGVLSVVKKSLAADAAPDIDEEIASDEESSSMAEKIFEKIKPSLSEDCDLSASDLADVIEAASLLSEDEEPVDDEEEEAKAYDEEMCADSVCSILENSGVPADVIAKVRGSLEAPAQDEDEVAEDEEGEEPAKDEDETKEEPKKETTAMDAASVNKLLEKERARSQSLYEAGEATRSVLGSQNVFAFDSAADIYKKACESVGLDVRGEEPSSYRAMFKVYQSSQKSIAQDAAPVEAPMSFKEHPHLANIHID